MLLAISSIQDFGKSFYMTWDMSVDEFARKLINQGMILGTSAFVYRIGKKHFYF